MIIRFGLLNKNILHGLRMYFENRLFYAMILLHCFLRCHDFYILTHVISSFPLSTQLLHVNPNSVAFYGQFQYHQLCNVHATWACFFILNLLTPFFTKTTRSIRHKSKLTTNKTTINRGFSWVKVVPKSFIFCNYNKRSCN